MAVFKKNRRLGEFAKIISGYAFKSSEFIETGIPVIKIKNIKLGEVDISESQFVSKEYLKIDEKYHINEGDILISLTGSHINQPNSVVGRVALFPYGFSNALLNQRAGKIIPINNECNKRFLYYHLFENEMRKDIASFAHGAANQANVSPSQVESLKIRTPPLLTQRKIATILSAYDDLIENNLRRIKILEEMAQNLYREWFVNFRFPGHENTRFVDSPLGQIPEGWEVDTVENTFTILGGGTPSKKVDDYWNNGEINWYTPSDLTSAKSKFMDESSNKITELGLKKSSAKLFPPFSVMMTSRATLGVVSINTTEASTNQGFITCIPNENYPLFMLYYWLLENVDSFINHASGATFKEISKGVFKTLEIIVPPKKVATQFEEILKPIGLEVLSLQRKNNILRQTRDLLLPKLISGEVDVSELDIKVPEEAVS